MSARDLYNCLLTSAKNETSKPALFVDDKTYTFGDLLSRIDAFSAAFQSQGIGRGDRIAIVLDKGLDYVACIFAAIRQRIVYVPLDSSAPMQRLASILAEAQPKALVTDKELSAPYHKIAPSTLAAGTPPEPVPGAETDIAYIIFTSGSTGTPKGVMIDHRGLMNFADWVQSYFARLRGETIMNIASFSFDQSVLDLVLLAALGCPIVLAQQIRNPMALLRAVEVRRVACISTVPNTFSFLHENQSITRRFDLSSLRTLILGGSPFHAALRDKLAQEFPDVSLFNIYGPTEATVYCSIRAIGHSEKFEHDPLPLGEPISNTDLFLIAPSGERLEGTAQGELVISGPQVMAGYYNDPTRTAAAMTIPGMESLSEKIYRTGDIVKRTEAGEYYFIGRGDDQTKTAGYRVSLLEIENVLRQLPRVAEACVVPLPDLSIENKIVAFLAADGAEAPDQLNKLLQDRLPRYMHPHHVFWRKVLPKSISGKIDRAALKTEAKALLKP